MWKTMMHSVVTCSICILTGSVFYNLSSSSRKFINIVILTLVTLWHGTLVCKSRAYRVLPMFVDNRSLHAKR